MKIDNSENEKNKSKVKGSNQSPILNDDSKNRIQSLPSDPIEPFSRNKTNDALLGEKQASNQDHRSVEFSHLKTVIDTYLPEDQIQLIEKAYQYQKKAHQGQKRKSGEDYYRHPLAVALILANMHADTVSIKSALLHDVVEDTKVSLDEISEKFGKQVAVIVDGVSKLSHFEFKKIQDKHAGNFLKMVLAMCRDVRVMLVKVADRLHNMRTLDSMPVDKQRLKAKETLDIYAPISMRLGLAQIQYELEDLGLRYLYPDRYRVLDEKILEVAGGRKNFVKDVEKEIKEFLYSKKISCEVFGRKKNLYSLYKKMRYKRVSFDQIEDTYAFRVILKDVDTCYRVLGMIHSFYTPIPKTVEDYIAMPKLNGYQSIHTEVIVPYSVRIEVQLRTEEMNQIAEYGVAAHWRYKVGGSSKYEENARNWISRVLQTEQESDDPIDFMEKMKMDLQPHEVYVLTPKGRIVRMPYDSIGVDFAFAIHTDIGLRAKSMIVNGNHYPITKEIKSGQKIEIITADEANVSLRWLYLVKTPKAKNAISAYFKTKNKAEFDELKVLGLNLLDKALNNLSRSKFDELKDNEVKAVLKSYDLHNLDELFIEIARGKLVAKNVAQRLSSSSFIKRFLNKIKKDKKNSKPQDYLVSAEKSTLARFARCCGPVPEDEIMTEIKSDGYVVHRRDCQLIVKKIRKMPAQYVAMSWDKDAKKYSYRSSFGVTIKNQPDAFTKITAVIGEFDLDVENIRHTNLNFKTNLIRIIVWVHSLTELNDLMKAIRSHSFVKSISRTS